MRMSSFIDKSVSTTIRRGNRLGKNSILEFFPLAKSAQQSCSRLAKCRLTSPFLDRILRSALPREYFPRLLSVHT